MLFLLALKWKLSKKLFSNVKTKTNSSFAVKVAERGNYLFLPSIIRIYLYSIRMSLVCTRMSSVYHSYVIVCHPYVTRMYSMSSVCHSYALICHPYVTRMWFYHESDICPNLFKNVNFLRRPLPRKRFQEEINSTEAYSVPGQTSKIIFTKTINT